MRPKLSDAWHRTPRRVRGAGASFPPAMIGLTGDQIPSPVLFDP